MRVLRFSGCLLLALTGVANAQQPGDWPTYGRDKGGQRHSPLDQITPANVGQLQPAWTYRMKPAAPVGGPDANAQAQAAAEGMGPPGRRRSSRFAGSQATPLIVNGRMFVSTPYGRVIALEPETGKELWATVVPGPGQPSLRGVEYWPGDALNRPRIVFGTRDGRLIALDAETGAFAKGFGTEGVVEMKTPEILGAAEARFYGMTSPPIIFEKLIITGSAVQEFPAKGAAGDVRAWDVRTGKLVWSFHSVPRKGEKGYDSWQEGSAEQRSGVNVWGFPTVDTARGIVYLPFAAPSFDRFGGDRKGDNLYSTSLVAADARTGKYLWHFQVVHHDIWDNDLQAPPLLFDLNGKPAVAIVSKNSLLFILDRVTGKPLHSIVEKPFPKSDVPGEQAAVTQPIPVNTPPLARTSFSLDEVADVTPELKAWCTKWIADNRMKSGGLYIPIGFNQTTISFPGFQGGANWGGAAYDPVRKLIIVNTSDLGQVHSLVKADVPLGVERGTVYGRFQMENPKMMCQRPPWGRLSAVDSVSGKVVWQVPLGVTDVLPDAKKLTGRPNIGGAITTTTGVTFIGASDDSRFRAFETGTGKMLWETRLEASAHATPATYRGKDGRQYVVVVATGGSFLDSPLTSDQIIAFALPTGGSK